MREDLLHDQINRIIESRNIASIVLHNASTIGKNILILLPGQKVNYHEIKMTA